MVARRPPSFAVLLVVVAAGLVASTASDGATSASLVRGKLVLVGEALSPADFDRNGLYVLNADGSGLRQIVRSSFPESPHWSPDGHVIVFFDGSDPSLGRVVLVRGDGSGRRVLGAGESLASPDPWSPDGRQLAWGGCGGLCVYDFASSRRKRIALTSGDAVGGFGWSPDGRRLVVAETADGLVVVVDLSGNVRSVLADAGQFPAYSPNGREIAFVDDAGLELVPAIGGRARILDPRADNVQPSWSPDGRRLLYTDTRRRRDAYGYAAGGVRVLNVATGTSRRVASTDRIARWSPDGAMVSFGLEPTWGASADDVWLARANGGRPRQLTAEFPTGVGYNELDWHSGSVPAGASAPPLQTVALKSTSELRPAADYVGELRPAATPDSVTFRGDDECDPNAETFSSKLTVWTASSGSTSLTTTPCLDLPVADYAVTASLAVWLVQTNPIDGSETMSAARAGTAAAPQLASWTSGQESPDIGWRSDIGPLRGDGTTIVFESDSVAGVQLWRITDATRPHAVQIPLPSDATDLRDLDGGRIVVATGKQGFAILGLDGAILARVPGVGTARLSGGMLGVASGNTLRVYDADSGVLRYQRPLADTTGHPQLLTIGNGHAVYSSGIALHLLRLDDGTDRTAVLPGQAGPLEALLTPAGLFISYLKGYDPSPGRLLFVPTANLP